MDCWACKQPITGIVVWMFEPETLPDEVPMHPHCADQPWPLCEKRRSWHGLDESLPPLTAEQWQFLASKSVR